MQVAVAEVEAEDRVAEELGLPDGATVDVGQGGERTGRDRGEGGGRGDR